MIKLIIDTENEELTAITGASSNSRKSIKTPLVHELAKSVEAMGLAVDADSNNVQSDNEPNESIHPDIILVEKPDTDGLTYDEIQKMAAQICAYQSTHYLSTPVYDVYPIEIEAHAANSSAMGFITAHAANILDFDYEGSGLNDFVALILDDMNNETSDGIYEFRGLRIKLTRNI